MVRKRSHSNISILKHTKKKRSRYSITVSDIILIVLPAPAAVKIILLVNTIHCVKQQSLIEKTVGDIREDRS